MSDKLDMTQIYAATIPSKSKENLLAVYKDYISLVRNLEYIVKRYRPSLLAGYQIQHTYGNKVDENPWRVENITDEEKKLYLSFVNNEVLPENKHYCFVSIDHTSLKFKNIGKGIISTPESYDVTTNSQSLPTRIERYVATYPKKTTLKEAEFLIAGRWKMKYLYETNGQSLKEALDDEVIEKRFRSMMDVLTLLPEDKSRYSERELMDAQTEAMASTLINPFENVLLSSLTSLSEESNKIIKKLLVSRAGDNYIFQAEKEGLIPSAAAFQDYQNIRHLMHHQWDTLDGLGKFNNIENVKNDSVRHRYLDSYGRLCDKSLVERVKSYTEVARNMSKLVATMNPNLLVREENESNSKFINRAKQYVKDHPNTPIMLETNYTADADKKEALTKNIQKVLPQAEIIDACAMDIDSFLERISVYLYRKNYLEIFQQVENRLSQHCLFYGKNIPPSASLSYFRNCKLISAEEAERWSEYKQLRNDLSHGYLNEELKQRLEKLFPDFMGDAFTLSERVEAQSPVVSLLHDNIYRARHANGKIVDIDYASKKIVNIEYPTPNITKNETKTEDKKKSPPTAPTYPNAKKVYIEEYANGISIGVNKTDITSCRLPSGVMVDLVHKNMSYPDGSRLYFNSGEHNCLTLKGGIKLMTDKKMKVQNYINKGKSVTLSKNENLKFPNGHGISIDKKGNWEKEEFVGSKGKVVKVNMEVNEQGVSLRFNDNTTLSISENNLSLTHNQIPLTYATRKKFAESYDKDMSLDVIKMKKGKEK